jgi:hypothetical protein
LLDPQPLVQQAAEAELARLTRGDTVIAAGGSSDTVSAAPGASPSQPAAHVPGSSTLTETWSAARLVEVAR